MVTFHCFAFSTHQQRLCLVITQYAASTKPTQDIHVHAYIFNTSFSSISELIYTKQLNDQLVFTFSLLVDTMGCLHSKEKPPESSAAFSNIREVQTEQKPRSESYTRQNSRLPQSPVPQSPAPKPSKSLAVTYLFPLF